MSSSSDNSLSNSSDSVCNTSDNNSIPSEHNERESVYVRSSDTTYTEPITSQDSSSLVVPSASSSDSKYYTCSNSNCNKSSCYTKSDTTSSDNTTSDSSSNSYYTCNDSKCSRSSYYTDNTTTNSQDYCKCGKKNCRKNRKHRTRKCSRGCDKKDCKYCKIFGAAPHYLGAQLLVANEMESNRSNIKNLYVDGHRVSINQVKERKTVRYTTDHNDLTNRNFILNGQGVSIDDLTFKFRQPSPEGGLLKSICINNKYIRDIIYNPTLKNIGAPETQVSISVLVVNINKRYMKDIRYASYKLLSKSVTTIQRHHENTLSIVWKGPIPEGYCHDPEYDSFLWFMGNASDNPCLVRVIDDETPDITIVY